MEVKLLLAAVTTLAAVIAYLFKLYVDQSKESRAAEISMVKERDGWTLERAKTADEHASELERIELEMQREFEKRKNEMLCEHDAARRRESEIFRAHEDQVRKEFAAIMERVAEQAEKSSEAQVQLMQKMFERFTGPRGH